MCSYFTLSPPIWVSNDLHRNSIISGLTVICLKLNVKGRWTEGGFFTLVIYKDFSYSFSMPTYVQRCNCNHYQTTSSIYQEPEQKARHVSYQNRCLHLNASQFFGFLEYTEMFIQALSPSSLGGFGYNSHKSMQLGCTQSRETPCAAVTAVSLN